jgi:hypothetical protein
MAKKNSSKTATQEARQASEPRAQVFNKWQGISIQGTPLDWQPYDDKPGQSDLDLNFWHVQNNVECTDTATLESRRDTFKVCGVPEVGVKFTGVEYHIGDNLYLATDDNKIWCYRPKVHDHWINCPMTKRDKDPSKNVANSSPITAIYHFEQTLIALTEDNICYSGAIVMSVQSPLYMAAPLDSAIEIPQTGISPGLTATPVGKLVELTGTIPANQVDVQLTFWVAFTNKFGSTAIYQASGQSKTIHVNIDPVEWSSAAYMKLTANVPQGYDITGVDFYVASYNETEGRFAVHVDVGAGHSGAISALWLGAMQDTSAWTSVSLIPPKDNTSRGPIARYLTEIDGRLYFWGSSETVTDKENGPHRLYIGGNPGKELSIARGTGGAWVDLPKNGLKITNVVKFVTYNTSSIITCICGSIYDNTDRLTHFNLLETSLSITNEISTKGYQFEEVGVKSFGCNSRWGSGVWEDGLYTINRYGLGKITYASESNNQPRLNYVSTNIESVFTSQLGDKTNGVRLCCIAGKFYMLMSLDDNEIHHLDTLILVYDLAMDSWYTYTHDIDEIILHAFSYDFGGDAEGLGLITPDGVYVIPITMTPELAPCTHEQLLISGQMAARQPLQTTDYLSQLEIHFNYIIGDLKVVLDGVDYYGRKVKVEKDISVTEFTRNYVDWMRVDLTMESYRVTISGTARFHMTHFIAKVYIKSKKTNIVYGFNDAASYQNRSGGETFIHHKLDSYNNLKDAIIT